MDKSKTIQEEVKTLNDYIKQLQGRIKTLEVENNFLEELNLRIMQTTTHGEKKKDAE